MNWQEAVALTIVGLTAGAFVWARWRAKGRQSACGSGHSCGCAGSAAGGEKIRIVERKRDPAEPTGVLK